jgi:hypothetical protein
LPFQKIGEDVGAFGRAGREQFNGESRGAQSAGGVVRGARA